MPRPNVASALRAAIEAVPPNTFHVASPALEVLGKNAHCVPLQAPSIFLEQPPAPQCAFEVCKVLLIRLLLLRLHHGGNVVEQLLMPMQGLVTHMALDQSSFN